MMMMILPNCQELGLSVLHEVGQSLDVFTIEIILHDIIQDFTFLFAVFLKKKPCNFIEAFVANLAHLKVILGIL